MKTYRLKLTLIVAALTFANFPSGAQKLFSSAQYVFSFNTSNNAVDTMGSFSLTTCYQPKGRLVHIGNGELIGITEQSWMLYGAIYKTDTTTGAITVLYEFNNNDRPQSSFTRANNGKLYCLGNTGTSNQSRIWSFDPTNNNYVNVFEITGNAGSGIDGGMVNASNGILYGVTQYGGTNNKGIIFSFNPANNSFNTLYNFTQADGCLPEGAMIQGADGKLYGTAAYGGVNDKGVIFSYDITTNTYVKLFDFVQATGECPLTRLCQASDGKFYGVTMTGGSYYQGVFYSFDAQSGTYTDLHDFFANEGYGPRNTPVEVDPGVFYGNCNQGGTNFRGSIYKYETQLSLFTKLFDGHDSIAGNFIVPFYCFDSPAIGIAEAQPANMQTIVYPNPFAANGTLLIHAENFTGKAFVTIFDLNGRLIRTSEIAVTNGEGKLPIDHEEIAVGVYVYTVCLQTGETLNGRFNVQ